MIHYILYSIVSLGISLAIYLLFLKREKNFQFNRFFLLFSLLLCLIAPSLEFSLPNTIPKLPEINIETAYGSPVFDENFTGTTVEVIDNQMSTPMTMVALTYFLIALVLFIRFGKNLIHILKLLKNVDVKVQGLNVIFIKEKNHSSSFFNYLFIHPEDYVAEELNSIIMRHEKIHSEQLHSVDVIFMELISCLFWFNPFIWMYKKAMFQNHEYLADQGVVDEGIDMERYSNSIIQSGNKLSFYRLSSGFNFIQTKNRLIMLHQSKSTVLKRTIKSVIAITLFAAIFTLSSFRDTKPQLVVVIDAGHGGHDPGNNGEKEVVLQISKALAQHSDQKVKIILTRDSDMYIPLKDRASFIEEQNPDLLISLHCNEYKNPEVNGVEAFYYKESEFAEQSHAYSKILIENQLEYFSDRGEIKMAGFFLLKKVSCPALYLELGFLTNEKDRAILTDEKQQENIAESLYESLLKIRESK